jgi:dipeptidyl aminopeptidase/acylaminoacyl peptidase
MLAYTINGNWVHVMNADGSNKRSITHTWFARNYRWSPGSLRIIFVYTMDKWSLNINKNEIYTSSVTGYGVGIRLTNNDVCEYEAQYSPDGTKIFYVRNDDVKITLPPNYDDMPNPGE